MEPKELIKYILIAIKRDMERSMNWMIGGSTPQNQSNPEIQRCINITNAFLLTDKALVFQKLYAIPELCTDPHVAIQQMRELFNDHDYLCELCYLMSLYEDQKETTVFRMLQLIIPEIVLRKPCAKSVAFDKTLDAI